VKDIRLSGRILAGIDGDRTPRVDDDDTRCVVLLVQELLALLAERGPAQVREPMI
jgi:hypothetical protein